MCRALQLFGLNTWQAFENVRSEGWMMLYRGVKPPLLQAMVSKSIMFGLYNFYDELLTSHFGEIKGLNLVAAGMAGTSEAVLAPFEVRNSNMGRDVGWCVSRLSKICLLHSTESPDAVADAQVQSGDRGGVRCHSPRQQVRAERALPRSDGDFVSQRTRKYFIFRVERTA